MTRVAVVLGSLIALMALSGCNAVNAWVAGAENNVITDAAGAANNLHTADTAAANAWSRASCALTLGGLNGAGSPTVTEAALKLCPPSGVSFTQVAPPQGSPPLNPFALPPNTTAPATH